MKKQKRAWVKIFEAFVAILIIMGVLVVIVSKQNRANEDIEKEIVRIQSFILTQVSENDDIRNDVLKNSTEKVNETIEKILPDRFNYTTRICEYDEICPMNIVIGNKDVYSDDVLIVGNLTSSNVLKLKLFLWEE